MRPPEPHQLAREIHQCGSGQQSDQPAIPLGPRLPFRVRVLAGATLQLAPFA